MTAHAPQHHATDEAGDELRDHIADLTRTTTHRERFTRDRVKGTAWSGDHVTLVPPLLWQLEHTSPTKAGDSALSGSFKSQPAAWLEALDTLARIDLEANRWVTDMGEPGDGTTMQLVQKLGSLMPSATRCGRLRGRHSDETGWCCTWHAVARDVHRWWVQARIVTGWQSPAWRPDNSCPMCGKRGGLRVRLGDHSALCVECRETWDQSTIGLLAEHIRRENLEEADDAPV